MDHTSPPSTRLEPEILPVAQQGQQRVTWLCLRSDHATVPRTEAAISATGTRDSVWIAIALAERSCGYWVRTVSQFNRSLSENGGKVAHLVRWIWELVRPRSFERIA